MANKKHYMPSKRLNPAMQARRIDDLQRLVRDSERQMKQIFEMVDSSYARHLEVLANFARHNMGNAIQTMYAALVKFDEEEEWVKEIKGAINNLNGILDSFKEVIPYEDSNLTIPKVLIALDTLTRSSCYMSKIEVNYVYDSKDSKTLNLPFQYMLQVLHNLMTNAIKALQDREEPKMIEVRAYRDEENCYFIIKDNGIGIAEENLDKIFEYRYTTTEGGSGIGLYFVKYIIENRLNGKVLVEQNIDEYSTIFNLQIPYGHD